MEHDTALKRIAQPLLSGFNASCGPLALHHSITKHLIQMKQFPFGLQKMAASRFLTVALAMVVLILSSCQKEEPALPADEFGLIQADDAGSALPVLATFSLDDPELDGNDAAGNLPPVQTDFLFDTGKELILLEGQSMLHFLDEELVNPAENLVGMTQKVSLFEPENDQRKVGSLEMTILSILPTGPTQAEIRAAVKFDFGHGTVFGEAILDFNSGTPESGADFQCQLREVKLLGGTRMLKGKENQLELKFLNGDVVSVSDDAIELSCTIGITL